MFHQHLQHQGFSRNFDVRNGASGCSDSDVDRNDYAPRLRKSTFTRQEVVATRMGAAQGIQTILRIYALKYNDDI